ncbi:MAG: ROK family protein [Acidimicrobiales bacterium]
MVTIGIDLGGTKLLGVAVDGTATVVAERKVPTPAGEPAVLAAVCDLVDSLVDGLDGNLADDPGPVVGVGVGAPGLVDRAGVLRTAPNLPGVVDLDVKGALAARFPGVAIRIDNDATCAAWAEYRLGASVGVDDSVLVTLGTGIGGGLVAGGRLVRGAHGFAGEIGHMVVDPSGLACPCGNRGCWERVASGSGLGRLGREAAMEGRAVRVVELAGGDPADIRGEHVTAAAAEGDAQAVAVMAGFAWWLALGLSNLANILDTGLFVLGGGLVASADVLLVPTRRAFADLVLGATERGVRIEAAVLGPQAGAVGAALLATAPD